MAYSVDQKIINFEVIKIAKELLTNEYIDQRANEHNRWLNESAFLWKTKRIALPYPVIPPWPTEADVVDRARVLMEFIEMPPGIIPPDLPPPTIDPPPDITPPPILPPAEDVPIPPPIVMEEAPVTINPTTASTNYQPEKMLPSVMQRIEKLRKNWRA